MWSSGKSNKVPFNDDVMTQLIIFCSRYAGMSPDSLIGRPIGSQQKALTLFYDLKLKH
jgi:hypothetical protein